MAAVKVCTRKTADDERYVRELRGAKLYRRIPPSEGLVRLLELGKCDGGFYVAMELADDEFGLCPDKTSDYRPKTLARVIAGEKALPLSESLKLAHALATGLATLQSHHLLHRDVKPGNVLYVGGRPVLSDPGLLVEESESASLVGTPGYVPPENFIGGAGDVYSLGLTLKAASFGRPVDELAKGPTLEADTANALFPAWWRILNKATCPDAASRYHSAKAMLKDLRHLRLRVAFLSLTQRVPRILQGVIIVLTLALCAVLLKAKLSWDASVDRQVSEARKSAAKATADAERVLRDIRSDLDGLTRKLKENRTR